jgi:hypothetical protein
VLDGELHGDLGALEYDLLLRARDRIVEEHPSLGEENGLDRKGDIVLGEYRMQN